MVLYVNQCDQLSIVLDRIATPDQKSEFRTKPKWQLFSPFKACAQDFTSMSNTAIDIERWVPVRWDELPESIQAIARKNAEIAKQRAEIKAKEEAERAARASCSYRH